MHAQRILVVTTAFLLQFCSAFISPHEYPSLPKAYFISSVTVTTPNTRRIPLLQLAAVENTSTTSSPLVSLTGGADQDLKSKLASAFAALDENDQYDAVLTGLCAKILDDPDLPTGKTVVPLLQDPISLLKEMNARKVKPSGRSLMALIDATVKTEDADSMARIMSLCSASGSIQQFGSRQTDITALPSSPTSVIRTFDGKRKTRQERLDNDILPIPADDRGTEVTAALAFSTFVGTCLAINTFGIMEDLSPFTNTLLLGLILLGIVDNFYDVIKFGTTLLTEKNSGEKVIDLPDELPGGVLGRGEITGTVVRGLARLTTKDTERECQAEAASFFAAYALGLPCFAFQPNALEAAVLALDSSRKESQVDTLLSNIGILKLLIWLIAPVAMESSKHAQLVVSDPREGRGFLRRLEDKGEALLEEGKKEDVLFWTESDQERDDLIQWAFGEADLLLRNNRVVVNELAERLAGGAATMGDLCAVMENW